MLAFPTGFENHIRFDRMRKLLYKVRNESYYVFPNTAAERDFFKDFVPALDNMINDLSNVLQKKTAEE